MTDASTRVVFFSVQTNSAKLAHIVQSVEAHFLQREKIILFAEDDKALSFLDELLWKMPVESFLPHTIVNAESLERIALTKLKKNLNEAKIAFNLCPIPLLIKSSFRVIYDFDDTTTPNKKFLSQVRFDAYKQEHLLIEAR